MQNFWKCFIDLLTSLMKITTICVNEVREQFEENSLNSCPRNIDIDTKRNFEDFLPDNGQFDLPSKESSKPIMCS